MTEPVDELQHWRMLSTFHEASAMRANRDAAELLQRIREAEREKEWLHKVAVRMYRHLAMLGADSLTLTSLAVTLGITSEEE